MRTRQMSITYCKNLIITYSERNTGLYNPTQEDVYESYISTIDERLLKPLSAKYLWNRCGKIFRAKNEFHHQYQKSDHA
jgi:hypothetical protein